MTAYEARKELVKVKSQLRSGNTSKAIDIAIQALVWKELQDKQELDFDDELE